MMVRAPRERTVTMSAAHCDGRSCGKPTAVGSGADDSLAQQYNSAPVPDEPEPGPRPLPKMDAVSYGGALRPGEGDAIAAYVQAGKRIPRRYGQPSAQP